MKGGKGGGVLTGGRVAIYTHRFGQLDMDL
jgi:hypothetical protein